MPTARNQLTGVRHGLLVILAATGLTASAAVQRSEIRIRDPFVLPDAATQTYYIYGTTTSGIFDGGVERKAVMVFKTKDLTTWDDPVPVWEVPAGHWGRETVWAPEVHHYRGKYYLFVTITSKDTLPTPRGPTAEREARHRDPRGRLPTGSVQAAWRRSSNPAGLDGARRQPVG